MENKDKDEKLKNSNEANVESSIMVPKVVKKSSNKANNNSVSGKSTNDDESSNVSLSNGSNDSSDNSDNLSTILDNIKKCETSNSSNTDNNDNTNSSVFKLDLSVLNEISRVCQLAMANISFLSSRITNHEMKKELVAIYSQYSNILLQINQHFEKYGEIPENVPIRNKIMGTCGIKMNTINNRTNSHIADIMIQGSLMGIIKCQKILNSNLDIEKSTIELLKTFNQFQRDNINKLNAYL